MRLHVFIATALLLATLPAAAQRYPLSQDGTAVPGHLSKFLTQGRVGDVGTANGDALGHGVAPFAVDDKQGAGLRLRDAPTSGAHHEFELGHDSTGNALLTLRSVNGAPLTDLYCDINGRRQLCLAPPVSGLPSVSSTAALALLPSTYAPAVVRLDTVSGAGSPPQLYRSTVAPCTLDSGAGDGGLEIPTSNGFCWVAALGSAGADARMWGQLGTADDTDTLTLADTAMQSEVWPIGTAKTILLPAGAINVRNFSPGIASLRGAGQGQTLLQAAATAATGDVLVNYEGIGPFEASDFTTVAPLMNQATLVKPPIQKSFRIANDGENAPVFGVKIHDITCVGGQGCVYVFGAVGAHLYNLTGDRQENTSFVLTSHQPGGSITDPSMHNTLNDIVCEGGGAYCISPTGGPHTVPTQALYDTIVHDVYAVGMGWKSKKMCFDGVTGASDGDVFRGITCRNAFGGGLEVKTTGTTNSTPGWLRNIDVDIRCFSNFDQGSCFWLPYENANTSPDLFGQVRGNVFTTWTPPAPYIAGAYYHTGQAVTSGGNSYMAVTPGATVGTAPTQSGIRVATAAVTTGGSGCLNGTAKQFAVSPGSTGVVLEEVIVSGDVTGGVLQTPLTPVSGFFRVAPTNPTTLVPVSPETCSVRPTTTLTVSGSAVSNDGAAQWLYIEPTPAAANNNSAARISASTDVDLTVVAQNVGYGIILSPVGSSDNAIRRHRYHLTADIENSCLTDAPTFDSDHPIGTIDRVALISPYCHTNNVSTTGAIWVGIANGAYINNWTNFTIDGGEIIAEKAYAIADHYITGGSVASIGMEINGTKLVSKTGVILDEASVMTVEQNGGSIKTTDGTGAGPLIKTGNNVSANLSYTAKLPIAVSNARPTAFPDYKNGTGATLSALGRFIDGFSATIPTTLCGPGQIVQSTAPGAGGQPVNGWYCGASNAWTAF